MCQRSTTIQTWRIRMLLGLVAFCASSLFMLLIAQKPLEEKELAQPPKLRSDLPLLPPVESLQKSVVAPLGDLLLEAESTSHSAIRDLLRRLAYPHDRVVLRNGSVLRVAPLARPWEQEKAAQLKLQVITPTGQVETQRTVLREEVLRVEYFERFAIQEVLQLAQEATRLQPPLRRSAVLQLADFVAEQVRAYHRDAVRQGTRGEGWANLEASLDQQHKQIRLQRLAALQQENQLQEATAWADRLLTLYPGDAEIVAQFRQLVETTAEQAIARQDYATVRRALDRLRQRLPGTTSPAIERYQRVLQDQADFHLKRAQQLQERSDWISAWLAGAEAARLMPNWERVQLFQRQLLRKYPLLIVAVPQLPQTTWPPLAATLSEQMAVALLYEWLVEPRQPPLASSGYWSSPGLVPFRQRGAWILTWPSYPILFQTPTGERLARWQDVEFSLAYAGEPRLLNYEPFWDKRWNAWQTTELPSGQWHLRIPWTCYDPMRLFYVPLLPADRDGAASAGSNPESSRTGGTGPYFLAERSDTEWVFRRRPGWTRPHAVDGPVLREIRFRRFTDLRQAHEDLECGAVHLVAGLTARDADAFADIPHARIVCLARQEATPAGFAFTPRVAMLAFHRRQPTVQSLPLRQAIAAALDREALLRTHYRGRDPTTYRLTGGPAPLASWTYHPDYSPTLRSFYRPAAARELFQRLAETATGKHGTSRSKPSPTLPTLSLWYPQEEPAVHSVVRDIRDQLAAYGLKLQLRAVTAQEILAAWKTPNPPYDLLFWIAEYPAEGMTPFRWLSPAPPGQAWPDPFGLADEPTIAQLRQRYLLTDDPAILHTTLHRLHAHLVEQAWIVPLWEMDRFLVVWKNLGIPYFHPCWVLHHVESWTWN